MHISQLGHVISGGFELSDIASATNTSCEEEIEDATLTWHKGVLLASSA